MSTGILDTPGITTGPAVDPDLLEEIEQMAEQERKANLNGPQFPQQRRRSKTRRDKSRAARARRGGR